jgi:FkbM family methyltransferase
MVNLPTRRRKRFRDVAGRLVRRRLHATGRAIVRRSPTLLEHPECYLTTSLEHLIALRLQDRTDLFFVEVGAFDGNTGDDLHAWIERYRWPGIIVEPNPRSFEKLKRTYAHRPDLTLRNVALDERAGMKTLYTIDEEEEVPHWAPQTASFEKAHVVRGLRGNPGTIVPVQVECIPFSSLLDGVERVDILQIDVEGFDWVVLRMFDFDRYRPAIVRWESMHLNASERDASIRLLISHGYQIATGGKDTIAWHSPSSPPLSR